MADALLSARGLTVNYGGIRAVDNVDFAIAQGEIVAMIGANGAGKSSVINTLIGHVRQTGGDVRLEGAVLAGLPPRRRAKLGIGYAPEGRRVFAGMTAEENLLVASPDGAAKRKARTEEMYVLFPQLGARRDAPAWQLSGGEQQMLAIARALMARPRLLLVDEPTLGLAPAMAQSVTAVLRDVAAGGAAVLLAEQNAPAALAICDRALLMRLGRIIAVGPAREIESDPRLAQALMGG